MTVTADFIKGSEKVSLMNTPLSCSNNRNAIAFRTLTAFSDRVALGGNWISARLRRRGGPNGMPSSCCSRRYVESASDSRGMNTGVTGGCGPIVDMFLPMNSDGDGGTEVDVGVGDSDSVGVGVDVMDGVTDSDGDGGTGVDVGVDVDVDVDVVVTVTVALALALGVFDDDGDCDGGNGNGDRECGTDGGAVSSPLPSGPGCT